MIFVVGTGRSGTNLLRQMLNCHPELYIATETHFISTLLNEIDKKKISVCEFCKIVPNHWTSDGSRWIKFHLMEGGRDRKNFKNEFETFFHKKHGTVKELTEAFFEFCYGDKLIFGDKTITYGLHMGKISEHWPEAKFIHMVRDGRFAARSMQKHSGFVRIINSNYKKFLGNFAYENRIGQFSSDPVSLEKCLKFWEYFATEIVKESRHVKNGNYIEIRYEELILYPLVTLIKIANFIGVKLNPIMMYGLTMPRPFTISRKQCKVYSDNKYDKITEMIYSGLDEFGYNSEWNPRKKCALKMRTKEVINSIPYYLGRLALSLYK